MQWELAFSKLKVIGSLGFQHLLSLCISLWHFFRARWWSTTGHIIAQIFRLPLQLQKWGLLINILHIRPSWMHTVIFFCRYKAKLHSCIFRGLYVTTQKPGHWGCYSGMCQCYSLVYCTVEVEDNIRWKCKACCKDRKPFILCLFAPAMNLLSVCTRFTFLTPISDLQM